MSKKASNPPPPKGNHKRPIPPAPPPKAQGGKRCRTEDGIIALTPEAFGSQKAYDEFFSRARIDVSISVNKDGKIGDEVKTPLSIEVTGCEIGECPFYSFICAGVEWQDYCTLDDNQTDLTAEPADITCPLKDRDVVARRP